MKIALNYHKNFLCVLFQYEVLQGNSRAHVKEWYPVRPADEGEVGALLGRPVTEVDSDEGIYVDEEGNVFQLAAKSATKPIDIERSLGGGKEEGNDQDEARRVNGEPAEIVLNTSSDSVSQNQRDSKEVRPKAKRKVRTLRRRSAEPVGAQTDASAQPEQEDFAPEIIRFAHLNLRQKLAVVRRRIGYVQKRGHNQRNNYSYVTAADIAGSVGDLLAELGVVVVPRLESISHELNRSAGKGDAEVARVVMSYTFVDVDTAEEITVKTAGEGLDSGDKAPYKAMTGALKYALLQSFLLATGDDPEDERTDARTVLRSEHPITAEQVRQLQGLIEETGTDLERVLAYYKISALNEIGEASYRRALELLNRKLATQSQRGGARVQN